MNIRNATAADIPYAAVTLAAAFQDYPWTRWSIPTAHYQERLEELQGLYLYYALEHGTVLINDQQQGVAAFLPPNVPEPNTAAQTRITKLLGDRIHATLNTEIPQRPKDSWNLATIGVHPDNWGQGIASALLADGLQRLDAIQAKVSLETSDPRNVALYSRYDFNVTSLTQIPHGPTVYSMLRERRDTNT
ncbi:GNAT family N-acetyltransferase [Corynebacterium pseudotuberculosis]|uniref:GNAT family N-acetyltransferase n=1 Tax=Corynebacterium pseudotuberculosis TaxID=1719 RepID=UPI0002660AE6|nr:GNAT family N-acetyltransferase [Corynebacterium pseudotuberculosis]AFM06449.1 GNAT family N-acetyltransferase [Corynebacterium pseudotuberculosis Cp162]APG80788.1 Puromycin N-acetyltransferase [Corynebacterium pseudotuberculosis]WFP67268.1 GNAT family N-acetyltransferase [Corynebacterium pseudotuberculosis]